MNYYSLHNNSHSVSFEEAVIQGIAPDRGLYFPERIPELPASFWNSIESLSNLEIARNVMQCFVGDSLSVATLDSILEDVLSFDFPLRVLTENTAVLELFHGPTMAFKDVGARFMARCLSNFLDRSSQEYKITVLVATSGDTGGAVARGFYKVPGINVVILYPSGKVSDVQEKQLTTLGENITALEVQGSFDDCQEMVKTAFLDKDITSTRKLTSANSINVARWLPQSLYYIMAYRDFKKLDKKGPLVFSVPSGNFGNICAGMVAHRMGMPVAQFIAAVNSNKTIPHFMQSGIYKPKNTLSTISNAMDVSDPSNFVRILELFDNERSSLSTLLSSYSFCDNITRASIRELKETYSYIADPHGAIGYAGLQKYLEHHPEAFGIFLETAHPIKFLPAVAPIVGEIKNVPAQIAQLSERTKQAIPIKNYAELKTFLINT